MATLRHILFDMDETLYPESSGLFKDVKRRIIRFVGQHFQLDPQESRKKHNYLSRTYGTTLGGLVTANAFQDTERYFDEVHPKDMAVFLKKDPLLVKMLSDLPVPKSVFTNSPLEHALRVLDFLEIRDQFEHIFDLRFNQLLGKPNITAFRRVLDAIALQPEEVMLVDDRLDTLLVFKEMGGRTVLVDESSIRDSIPNGTPRISDVKELPRHL